MNNRDEQQRQDRPPLRVLFWGMRGAFSRIVLAHLLESGVAVCGVVTPGEEKGAPPIRRLRPQPTPSKLPLLTPHVAPNALHLAWEAAVPVYAVARLQAAATRRSLHELRPDVACVACFPWRIPPALLALPPHGFLNVHPSLLPALRGPAPLFWTFWHGRLHTGVTIHFMDEGLDSGDIALQTAVTLPEGIGGPEADRLLAQTGGQLLVEALHQLAAGTLPRRPQPAEGASAFPWPRTHDFHIPTSWSAQRAFRFIRGTADWQQPYFVVSGSAKFAIRKAIAYDPCATQPEAVRRDGRDLFIRFAPGVVHARA